MINTWMHNKLLVTDGLICGDLALGTSAVRPFGSGHESCSMLDRYKTAITRQTTCWTLLRFNLL